MRCLSLLLVLLTVPAFADDKPKPNTLTPKEIADGWVLLFDGETTFGWTVEGDVKVKDGAIVVGGAKAGAATSTTVLGPADYSFEFGPDGTGWRTGTITGNQIITGTIGGKADPVYALHPEFKRGSDQL